MSSTYGVRDDYTNRIMIGKEYGKGYDIWSKRRVYGNRIGEDAGNVQGAGISFRTE